MSKYTAETLTRADIASWTGPEMRQYMASPLRETIIKLVSGISMEEAAQIQDQQRKNELDALSNEETPEQKAEKEAAEAARVETERLQAEVARQAAENAKAKQKIVVDYQIKDEDGNPIGRPTHLEADTEDEMRAKIIDAHTHATRAFHRLKKVKANFKDEQPIKAGMTDEEIQAEIGKLKDDPAAVQARITEEVNKRVEASRLETERQIRVSQQFLNAHKEDFYNCQANVDLIKEYFHTNNLSWTYDNLEIAFNALESKLAPVVVEPAAPVAPANPAAPVVPTTTTPAVPPVVQPTVPATVQPATPVNPVVVEPRPGVNGGIIPGQTGTVRPNVGTTQPTGLTAEEISSWDGPTMRAKMGNRAIRPLIEKFLSERNAKVGRK